jgi:hypothetical protein
MYFGYPFAFAVGMGYTQKFLDIYLNNIQAGFQCVLFVRVQHKQ